MKLLDFMNSRARRLSIVDWKLAQGAAICVALVAVKLFPELMKLNIWWFVFGAALLYIKPLYRFYIDP